VIPCRRLSWYSSDQLWLNILCNILSKFMGSWPFYVHPCTQTFNVFTVHRYLPNKPNIVLPQHNNNLVNIEHYYKDHCNDVSQAVKKSREGTKVENEFLIDGGKSAVMTIR